MGAINWIFVKLSVSEFVRNHQAGVLSIAGKTLQAVIVIVLSLLIIKFGSIGIKKFFEQQKQFKYTLDGKRTDTLSTLCTSILRYSVYFIALVTILKSTFNIDATTIITAAGVGGLAIGFGAQSLVKDVITGFFILLEDQFSVGDSVTIDGMTGNVEEMGLRITKLRHFSGDLYIIPNSEIKKVTNHTRGNKTAIVDVAVAYEEQLDRAFKVLNKVCEDTAKDFETIVEGPTLLGVMNFGELGVMMRIQAKTLPGAQWELEREIRKRVKEAFDAEKIKIPYRPVVVNQNVKDGAGDSKCQ